MEDVLDVYHRPYDESRPLVCLDESSKQLIGETREPIPPAPAAPAQPGSVDQPAKPGHPGHPERYDFEYVRNGTANLFMVTQPLLGWRHVEVTDRRTAKDFAEILRWLAEDVHPEAKKIVLVMDNLNTHKLASLYEAFEPSRARALAERFEIHHTPKHGSWLNMAEIEFSVLNRQCLDCRIATKDELMKEIAAWEDDRNDRQVGIRWRFTVENARIKLHRLYPASE
jgi:DDE superfamily endonuclease